ncbi:GNAT family N-acetyltransferase [Candidatus Latescibacterota bacterium]
MIKIREEQKQDIQTIHDLNLQAFGQPQESDIVDKLRDNCNDLISLVAIMDDQVVGHILFSPATIENEGQAVLGMGLAPMAVLPEYQNQGIGSELIRSGIKRLAIRGCPFAIVLGHSNYYPRFGFVSSSRFGIKCEWEVPDEVFMILVLNKPEMAGVSGVARYRPEFANAI